ncbi:hypothetical protein TNCV_4401 [Trichonephila clavipes]|nr:hypothetical protein TNCV_4401 [Trichonephila clavipes]
MPAQVSSSSLDHGSKSWFVAKSPRVAEQCDGNIHSLTHLTWIPFEQFPEIMTKTPWEREKQRLRHLLDTISTYCQDELIEFDDCVILEPNFER